MTNCPICNKHLKTLTHTHLKVHNLTTLQFKELYPSFKFDSEQTTERKKSASAENNLTRSNSHREKYQKNPKKCKQCESPINFEKKRNSFCSLGCSTSYNNKKIWSEIDSNHSWRKRRPCFSSKGEKELFSYMQKSFPEMEWNRQRKFYYANREFVVDMYSDTENTIIEYDGRIHFVPYYGEKRLEEVRHRDFLLAEFCKKNNIKLIRINEKTFYSNEWKKEMESALMSKERLHLLYLKPEV